jgi:hypothetical protein
MSDHPVCAERGMLRDTFLTAHPPLLCKEWKSREPDSIVTSTLCSTSNIKDYCCLVSSGCPLSGRFVSIPDRFNVYSVRSAFIGSMRVARRAGM